MDEHLYKFLEEWLAWAEAGAKDHTFKPYLGLCTNYSTWLKHKQLPPDEGALTRLLYDTAGSASFPFNTLDGYFLESEREGAPFNPARLAWVRARIAEWEER